MFHLWICCSLASDSCYFYPPNHARVWRGVYIDGLIASYSGSCGINQSFLLDLFQICFIKLSNIQRGHVDSYHCFLITISYLSIYLPITVSIYVRVLSSMQWKLSNTFIVVADFEIPLKEDELEQDTVVHIIYPSEPPVCIWYFCIDSVL